MSSVSPHRRDALSGRGYVPASVVELLDRSGVSLRAAGRARVAEERFVAAHLCALRAAAAVLAARTTRAGSSRPRSVWEVLPTLAPELTEWAGLLRSRGGGAGRRRARGAPRPAARAADDLVRQAETFIGSSRTCSACRGPSSPCPNTSRRWPRPDGIPPADPPIWRDTARSRRWIVSSTCMWPRATPCSTAPRPPPLSSRGPRRSGSPRSRSPIATGSTGRSGSSRRAPRPASTPSSGSTSRCALPRRPTRPAGMQARPGPPPRCRLGAAATAAAARCRAQSSTPTPVRGGGARRPPVAAGHRPGQGSRRGSRSGSGLGPAVPAGHRHPSGRGARHPGDQPTAAAELRQPRRRRPGAGLSCCSDPTPTSVARCLPDVSGMRMPGAGALAGGPPVGCPRPGDCLPRRPGGHPREPGSSRPDARPGPRARCTRRPHGQVRHADPAEAATVDVLDAARRLVTLDVRHLDRVTTAGHLAPTPAMVVDCDIVQASGPGLEGGAPWSARALWPCSRARGRGRRVRPRPGGRPRDRRGPPARAQRAGDGVARGSRNGCSPQRCRAAVSTRYPGGRRRRAARVARPARRRAGCRCGPGLSDLFPHRGHRHRPDPRDGGPGGGARVGGGSAWSTTCSGSPGSTRSATTCSWSGSARRCGPNCPTSTSTSSRPGAPRSTSDPRPLRRRAGHLRVDDGHLPGAARDPRRRRRARAAARRGRRDGQGIPAHLGPPRPLSHRRPARVAGARPRQRPGMTCSSTSSSGSTDCPGISRCTRAG
jgi:hypothetical protein